MGTGRKFEAVGKDIGNILYRRHYFSISFSHSNEKATVENDFRK